MPYNASATVGAMDITLHRVAMGISCLLIPMLRSALKYKPRVWDSACRLPRPERLLGPSPSVTPASLGICGNISSCSPIPQSWHVNAGLPFKSGTGISTDSKTVAGKLGVRDRCSLKWRCKKKMQFDPQNVSASSFLNVCILTFSAIIVHFNGLHLFCAFLKLRCTLSHVFQEQVLVLP